MQAPKNAEVGMTDCTKATEKLNSVGLTSALKLPHLGCSQGVGIIRCSQALRWDHNPQICTRSMCPQHSSKVHFRTAGVHPAALMRSPMKLRRTMQFRDLRNV